jgi:hypothetical protein
MSISGPACLFKDVVQRRHNENFQAITMVVETTRASNYQVYNYEKGLTLTRNFKISQFPIEQES